MNSITQPKREDEEDSTKKETLTTTSMNMFFELCQARSWALYTLNSHNFNVYLDITNVSDPSWEWFLREVPQTNGSIRLNEWKAKRDSHYIVYSKQSNVTCTEKDAYLHVFQCDLSHTTKYVGVYDKDGIRLCDLCLIIWDIRKPHVTNQGFADGRCPRVIMKSATFK